MVGSDGVQISPFLTGKIGVIILWCKVLTENTENLEVIMVLSYKLKIIFFQLYFVSCLITHTQSQAYIGQPYQPRPQGEYCLIFEFGFFNRQIFDLNRRISPGDEVVSL